VCEFWNFHLPKMPVIKKKMLFSPLSFLNMCHDVVEARRKQHTLFNKLKTIQRFRSETGQPIIIVTTHKNSQRLD